MSLPSNTTIYFSQVNTELGKAATSALYMSQMRGLAGVPSGTIYMSQLWGKSSAPAQTALSATGVNGYTSASASNTGSQTVYCYPSVNPSGGNGSYTYSWSITNNAATATLSNATAQTPTLQKTVPKNSQGTTTSTLQCVVSSNGASVTVSNIAATFDIGAA